MALNIRLGERLRAVAGLVEKGARVIDVGTDHAFLPVYLLINGIAACAAASDVAIGPIRRAELTVKKFNLENRLKLKNCSGLSGFSGDDADTVIIAGMGGETIATILEEAPWTKDCGLRLILQPMSSAEKLRKYLFSGGYAINREVLAKDSGKIYTVLGVSGNSEAKTRYEPFELYASRGIINDPLAGEYLNGCVKKLQKKKEGILSAKIPKAEEIIYIDEVISGLVKLKGSWKHAGGEGNI